MDTGGQPALPLPEGLAELLPGPELSRALASLDERRLTARQLTVVVAARCRQISYEQSRLLVTMRELSYAPAQERKHVVRAPEASRFNAMEAAMAATWTQYRTDQVLQLAVFALEQVPDLGVVLAAGRIDMEKIKVIHRLLAHVVDVETLRALVAMVLPGAARCTSAALRARVQRLLVKLDPAALRRQLDRDHTARFLQRQPDPSGLVTLCARFADPAAAAYDHVDAIASATRAAGDPLGRNIDQLRHDIALNLLAGTDPASAGGATPAQRKGTVTVHVNLATLVGLHALLGHAAPSRPAGLRGCTVRLGPMCGLGGSLDDGPCCASCRHALAELVDEPGEIAGLGPVAAHIARQTAGQLAGVSRWRYAVDDDGQLIAEGALPERLLPGLVQQMRRWAVDATAGPDGRGHYRPTAAQVAFVRARDRRCQAPGCRVAARKCQIDHRIPWHQGGPTFVDNLYCVCQAHHRAKDEGGFRYRPTTAGMRWTTPCGQSHTKENDTVTARHRHRGRCRGPVVIVDLSRGRVPTGGRHRGSESPARRSRRSTAGRSRAPAAPGTRTPAGPGADA